MSVKIYSGYKIWAKSLDEVIQILSNSKKSTNEELLKMTYQEFLLKAIKFHDLNIIRYTCLEKDPEENEKILKELNQSALSASWMDNVAPQDKKRQEQEEENCEIMTCIYPEQFKDKNTGKKYYLFTYHGDRNLEQWFTNSISQIEEYGYWNNTDKPEELTERQWKRRKLDWDIALLKDKSGVPVENGLSFIVGRQSKKFTMIDPSNTLSIEVLENLLKTQTIEKRIKTYVEDFLVTFIYNESIKTLSEEQRKNVPLSNVVKVYHDVRDNKISDQMKELKKLKEKEFGLILGEITFPILETNLDQLISEAKTKLLAWKLDNQMDINNTTKIKAKI